MPSLHHHCTITAPSLYHHSTITVSCFFFFPYPSPCQHYTIPVSLSHHCVQVVLNLIKMNENLDIFADLYDILPNICVCVVQVALNLVKMNDICLHGLQVATTTARHCTGPACMHTPVINPPTDHACIPMSFIHLQIAEILGTNVTKEQESPQQYHRTITLTIAAHI